MKKSVLRKIAGCALAGSTLFAGSAMALPLVATINNVDGPFVNFGGLDWIANGTAVVAGFNPLMAISNFSLTYWASATAVTKDNGLNFTTPGLNNTYEYTLLLTLNETSTCTTPLLPSFASPCAAASFQINSGAFSIYYDTTPVTFANQVTGTGITDGVKILSGVIPSQVGG